MATRTESDPSPSPGSPSFRYEAQTPDGQILKGTLEAGTAAEASEQLLGLQLRVLAVEPADTTAPRRRRALGPDDFMVFNQQLAHLTSAGLPIERGLRLIAADMQSGRLASAANAVAGELERGVPLADAFAHHASRFPSLYGRLVDAGVRAANLPGMLFNLSHNLDLNARLRRSLWQALAYPAMVLVAMSLVLLFISMVVLPQFHDIFKDFRTSLPALTIAVLSLSTLYPPFILTVYCVVAAAIVIVAILRLTGRSGFLVDYFLWIPLIGGVLRANLLARWIDALRLSVDAGLDLPHAVDLASDALGSRRMTREGRAMADLLVSGKPSYEFSGRLIPQTIPASIDLAGREGDLQASLATLTRMYQQQAEHRIRLIPSLVTPFALLFISSVVLVTMVALFLPWFKLIQSISGGEGA